MTSHKHIVVITINWLNSSNLLFKLLYLIYIKCVNNLVNKIFRKMRTYKTVLFISLITIIFVYWSLEHMPKEVSPEMKFIQMLSTTARVSQNPAAFTSSTSLRSSKTHLSHFRIACLGTKESVTWDGYFMRCKLLQFYAKLFYAKTITIEPLIYEQATHVKESFDAAIFIKTSPPIKIMPTIWKKFNKIYVDVIDGKKLPFKLWKLQHPPPILIVQNVFQQKLYNDTFKTVIIEHWPASINSTDLVDIKTLRHPLQAISSMQINPINSKVCKEINTSSVNLKCANSSNQKEFFAKELNMEYDEYKTQLWGAPWLFTQTLRKYDVAVVFTKRGKKVTINSVQRMSNAIQSGVITVIERTGLHTLYVSKNYPCSFTNRVELKKVLENLAKNVSMRETCQRQAQHINQAFQPEIIMRKYFELLTSE